MEVKLNGVYDVFIHIITDKPFLMNDRLKYRLEPILNIEVNILSKDEKEG